MATAGLRGAAGRDGLTPAERFVQRQHPPSVRTRERRRLLATCPSSGGCTAGSRARAAGTPLQSARREAARTPDVDAVRGLGHAAAPRTPRIASVYREQPPGPFPEAPGHARAARALVVPLACVPTTASSVVPSPWDHRWRAASMNSLMTSRAPLSARQAPPATPRPAAEGRQSLHREDRSLLDLVTSRLALSSSFAYDHIGSYSVPRERVPSVSLSGNTAVTDAGGALKEAFYHEPFGQRTDAQGKPLASGPSEVGSVFCGSRRPSTAPPSSAPRRRSRWKLRCP